MAFKKPTPEDPVKKGKFITPEEYYKKVAKQDKDTIVDVSAMKAPDLISTGSWVINTLIGGRGDGKQGGLPRGCIVEVLGDEASGKTTLGLSTCKAVQDAGGVPVYVDFEHSFQKSYAESMGINLNKNKFICHVPDYFEQGARIINESLIMAPQVVVVDSVAAMLPKAFLDGGVDEAGRIGLHAALMSQFLRYINRNIPNSNTCILFVNQMRSVIKKDKWERGPDKESTSGAAIRYYSSVRLLMEKGKVEEINTKSTITGKDDKKAVNMTVKVSVIKNKIDMPFRSGPVLIRFGEGFDNLMSVAELAINTKVIQLNGAFYRFDDGDTTLFNVQGKEALRRKLKDEPAVYERLKSKIKVEEDQSVKQEYEKEDEEDMNLEDSLAVTTEKFMKKKK